MFRYRLFLIPVPVFTLENWNRSRFLSLRSVLFRKSEVGGIDLVLLLHPHRFIRIYLCDS